MNIFFVEKDPIDAAQSLVDKHVVKMILESAQILSTAHRVLDGVETIEISPKGRRLKRWKHTNEHYDENLYKSTHINHPSVLWARERFNNYMWLYEHFLGLLEEYTFRYGKQHACERLIDLLQYSPFNIKPGESAIPLAMPEDCKLSDPIESYRKYYNTYKKHLFSWKKRNPPDWAQI